MNRLARLLTFIRFSHTVFALPFALGALFVAADGLPSWKTTLCVLAAMVCARTAAMSFNRLVDWQIDQRNPRTAGRCKLVTYSAAVALCAVSSVGFVIVAGGLNRICFFLSPLAIAIIFFYSLTKRWTSLSHFFLGLALAVAPVGAWLAVTGEFAWPPLVLAAGVVAWVAGFDIIYATQDVDFDRKEGLHSLVVRLGIPRSLGLAQWLHAVTMVSLAVFGVLARLGWIYCGALVLLPWVFFYEHGVAKSRSLEAINKAFFTSNALVGAIFVTATLLDRLLH